MDSTRLRADQVAERLNVSAQTIRNWRSAGIPPRRASHVEKLIREWESNPLSHIGPRLTIRATEEQITRWNIASMNEQKTIEAWAVDGLEKLARQTFANPAGLSMVADAPGNLQSPSIPASGAQAGKIRYPKGTRKKKEG